MSTKTIKAKFPNVTAKTKCRVCKKVGKGDTLGWRYCPRCDTLYRAGVSPKPAKGSR